MGAKALVYCAGGGIGDSLMASVVARALRGKFETVDALTLPAHRDALAHVPDLDAVYTDDGEESAVVQATAARAYDAVVVTWATARTARIAEASGIRVRVGQSHRLYSRRFTHRVDVRSEHGDVTTHWSQILLDYARALGCDTSDAAPAFAPSSQDRSDAQDLLAQIGFSRFAIVHAANAAATERGIWPTAGWARLARELAHALDASVLLTGSAADRPITAQIARESGAADVAGQLSIGAFGALAQRSVVFTGITTGSMHVAAASGAATVGIFPFQTDTPERWAPLGKHTAVVRATYPCRRGERKETCPDYACIEALDVPRIVAAAQSLVAAAA